MNIQTLDIAGDKTVSVTLSRRNLEHLLKALDMNVGMPSLRRMTEDGTRLFVVAEENVPHYGSREPGPGFADILPEAA